MASFEYALLVGSVLLIVSIVASKVSSKVGVPALLLFLLIGMLAGSEGLGGIYFDDPRLTQSLGVAALVLILFAGGLDTDWPSVRPVVGKALALSTLGVLLTAVFVGWFATVALKFSLLEGLLLGAIFSSTDAAAVFSVLRSKNVSLQGELKPLLELESGSNDPMAVFLTVSVISLLTGADSNPAALIPAFLVQMPLGALAGYGAGKGMGVLINRVRLDYEGLYPVLSLALILFTYGATSLLGGNGFLAVYVAGLVLGNMTFLHKRSLTRFHDGLAWLMQIIMFVAMGLLVFPSRLLPVAVTGLLVALFVMFVARPAAVLLTLLPSKMSLRAKAMVSWVGLRGAVPIILATYPLLAGLPAANEIFNVVFFIVLTSVLLQGTSVPMVARWLRVDAPMSTRFACPLAFEPTGDVKNDLLEVDIVEGSPMAGRQILELGLPNDVLIMLVNRGGNCLVPTGGTVIETGDVVLVFADRDLHGSVRALAAPKASPPDSPGAEDSE
jgi:cell volume regulation protein A